MGRPGAGTRAHRPPGGFLRPHGAERHRPQLAPDDDFGDDHPTVTGEIDTILADASRMLDAGHPASALLGLTAAYHEDSQNLPDLHPLWSRAYDDLNRPLLRERLDVMLENHLQTF
ncbi:hypothetical protein [Actinomadura sp. B10D3]|uniref:hypothetical protein n=1 Tax=Actinomadura sp. B10D3 TaxID=3153557 RepID=UPI00325DF1DE